MVSWTAVSDEEAPDGLWFMGPCAAAGGAFAGFMVSEIMADSSSQLTVSLCITRRTQGTVIAAQMVAQTNGTAQPISSLVRRNGDEDTVELTNSIANWRGHTV